MIVGNGDIASAIEDCCGFLFFASGVSDSSLDDKDEFRRELNLLLAQPRHLHLVYFSSLAIYGPPTPYADHKYSMEFSVRRNFSSCTIVRLGNILWGKNPHTLINVLRDRIKKKVAYREDYVCRFLVGKNEFQEVMKVLVRDRPTEINVDSDRMIVSDIVSMIKGGII